MPAEPPTVVTVPAPAACPECAEPWDAKGACPRCALERGEAERFRAASVRRAEAARLALVRGDVADALSQIRASVALATPTPEIVRLSAIIHALSGEWDGLDPADLPESWQEMAYPDSAAARNYQTAYHAAQDSNWETARTKATLACGAAPWFLPAQKLRILALYKTGHLDEAHIACDAVLLQFSEDPDLLRYQQELRRALPEQAAPPSSPPPPVPETRTPLPRIPWWAGLGATALAGVCFWLGMRTTAPAGNVQPSPSPSVVAVSTPSPAPTVAPIPSPTPAAPAAVAAPPPTSDAERLPAPLKREADAARRAANRTLARAWFNRAYRAYRNGDARAAGQFADAALTVADGTEYHEESLWLRAKAAEQAGRPDAAALYRAVYTLVPASLYAPLARRAEARLAGKRATR